ncbi:hypothetical protein GIB67_028161 [Kingdonia uniflora]|uniref:Uncharacterized protein n=1 Tax=Kingdonia uniflora TaxID=39325 RepID=A0A7J7KZW3_9MAGN|nr:hypothetical protein GIB67_028161 [Kingdonia uniflora]
MVIKVWKKISTIQTIRDPVVKIFERFIDIRLEIGITPMNFTMLTSLSIDKYHIQVLYDDRWSILSEVRQLFPRIESNNTKSGNVSIAHMRTYLTITNDRADDITVVRDFIIFMMGYLWFQTANDTVLLGYREAVADLDEAPEYDWGSTILASLYHGLDTAYWFYEYCGVGHPIVKEALKITSYPCLKTWENGNRKKTNDKAGNLFTITRYLIDHQTIESIN